MSTKKTHSKTARKASSKRIVQDGPFVTGAVALFTTLSIVFLLVAVYKYGLGT